MKVKKQLVSRLFSLCRRRNKLFLFAEKQADFLISAFPNRFFGGRAPRVNRSKRRKRQRTAAPIEVAKGEKHLGASKAPLPPYLNALLQCGVHAGAEAEEIGASGREAVQGDFALRLQHLQRFLPADALLQQAKRAVILHGLLHNHQAHGFLRRAVPARINDEAVPSGEHAPRLGIQMRIHMGQGMEGVVEIIAPMQEAL